MRITTLLSIGILAVSTAALAQVASTPAERKVPTGNTIAGNDLATPDTMANVMANVTPEPNGDTAAPIDDTTRGDPVAASSAPRK